MEEGVLILRMEGYIVEVGRMGKFMGMVCVWGLRGKGSILVFGSMVLKFLVFIYGWVEIIIKGNGFKENDMDWV